MTPVTNPAEAHLPEVHPAEAAEVTVAAEEVFKKEIKLWETYGMK